MLPREPIRLKVTYRSAESLVTEYTTCVSKGGCTLVSQRRLELGTRFRFEMYASGRGQPLELEGEVTQVQPIDARQFELGIQYTTVALQRNALDALLSEITIDPGYETRRKHPRIPVNLIALDRCVIRDLSCGGMRIHGRGLARPDTEGSRVTLFAYSDDSFPPFEIGGTIVWGQRGTHVVRTRLGIRFDELADAELMVVIGMTRLWRPRRLELEFFAAPPGALLADEAGERPRFTRTARDVAEMIRESAAQRLVELEGLELRVADPATARDHQPTEIARVGLVGDIDGELIVEASQGLAAQIASNTLGEPVAASDRALVVDALAELVTGIAGGVCDDLDDRRVELEVTAPLDGLLNFDPRDHLIGLELEGPHGRMSVSVLARHRPRSGWPG